MQLEIERQIAQSQYLRDKKCNYLLCRMASILEYVCLYSIKKKSMFVSVLLFFFYCAALQFSHFNTLIMSLELFYECYFHPKKKAQTWFTRQFTRRAFLCSLKGTQFLKTNCTHSAPTQRPPRISLVLCLDTKYIIYIWPIMELWMDPMRYCSIIQPNSL